MTRTTTRSTAANFITIRWYIDDVKHVRPHLTSDQARQVLQKVLAHHDATIGVSWEVLEIVADDLFPSLKERGQQ